jgi:hypothetical protein
MTKEFVNRKDTSPQVSHITLHASFSPGQWLEVKYTVIVGYEEPQSGKSLGPWMPCMEGNPLDIWLMFTEWEINLLYYSTEFHSLLQQSALP